MSSFTTQSPNASNLGESCPIPHAPQGARPDGPLPGDILLFTHAKGLSRLIPWFTGSRYYHCGLYEGHNRVLEARPQGVVRRNLKRGELYPFRVIPMPREGSIRALDFIRRRLGATYDPLDIAFIIIRHTFPLLRFQYRNHSSFTCGELVLRAWRAGHCDLLPDLPAAEVIPADFARFLPCDAHDTVL
ncbi:hypothetical protein EON83_18260 [bacterium]|nr:MAG: hypothetical protein EON83_18260 [bacterium]